MGEPMGHHESGNRSGTETQMLHDVTSVGLEEADHTGRGQRDRPVGTKSHLRGAMFCCPRMLWGD